MTDSMHRNTPSLTVFDSRGLTVRQTAYYRAQTDAQAQACVNAVVYDSQGRATAAWDPRLFELHSAQPDLQPNLATVYSLSGAALSSHSVDAGSDLSLSAESGAVLEQWDARGTHWQTEYDDYPRPIAVHEQMAGQPSRTCERFTYAGSNTEAALRNQCGQLIRVDDGAGTLAIAEYGLMGGTLMEERRLLTLIEPPDWPSPTDERDALLEPGQGAVTRRQFDATGGTIRATDARDNLQIMGLNIAGQLAQVTLALMNSTPQVLLRDVQYNANGQITSQTAGNGVVSQYGYNDSDARLDTLQTTRAANDPLQLLTYGYDPVGNVTSIADDAQAVRHFANQRIEPINRYTYDSFYQLVEAQGRETANASSGPQLPDMQPLPIDSNQWLNFTERYRYDSAGNLTQLRHEGSQPYTRGFEIHGRSNRALANLEGSSPPDFASGFDASGNLQYLSPGQTMSWDARNRLLKVTPVSRKDADDDAEHYVYDSSGQRVRKIGTSTARAASHTREVRYFPGLELRSDSANDEQLEVIVIQAGRCAVRCLHWLRGRPADIENDQLRYSVDDHLGSSMLELDGSARLISHEGYYPFGGTAWWSARSAIEATYKVVRYSGKERDTSGLYYYGLRYYAPWLMRWISPDPAGAVDGLNIYQMVRNNPINNKDLQGLQSFDAMSAIAGAAIAITLAIAGFLFHQYQQRGREKTAALQRELQINDFLNRQASEFNLTDIELNKLKNSVARAEGDIEWMHIAHTKAGQLQLYRATNPEQHSFLTKHKHDADFSKQVASQGIFAIELRKGIKLPHSHLARSSISTNASAGSFAFSDSSQSFSGTSEYRRASKDSNYSSKRSSRATIDSQSTTNTFVGREVYLPAAERLDSEGFFEDSKILKWLKKPANVALGMEEAIRKAIADYDGERPTHTGLRALQTLDIPTESAGGRGDYRLGLKRIGGTLRPYNVMTHRAGGKVQVTRGDY